MPAAPFHERVLRDWYTTRARVVQTIFRGGAKTTLGEEAVTILACLGVVHNIPIIGSSDKRAKERLEAIKHELTTNERLHTLFGYMGESACSIWQADKIVLPNNVCIQSLGWNQSMRGLKYLEYRPDYCWIDDIEDEENSSTPEARQKVVKRLLSVVIPAVDAPGARLRVTGTIIEPESLVVKLAQLPQWKSRVFPARYTDHTSSPPRIRASWPERKSLTALAALEAECIVAGEKTTFDREYMCQAIPDEDRSFTSSLLRADIIPRTYQSTYAIYDPARTTNASSAHTGKVVFSWQNNKLLVWESSGNFWMPDQIVHDIFQTDAQYNTTLIGVEQDGLHEFLMQPIRHEALKRGHVVPIRPLKAPKGKLSFIRALQPFFKAGEVIFVPDIASHQTLKDQLLNFPSGKIDIPNALAYALIIRPGQPILDSFDPHTHVDPLLAITPRYPLTLAIHSENRFTAGVLVQLIRSRYHVLADWMLEGDPGSTLADLLRYAASHTSTPARPIAPPEHFATYSTSGLRAAASAIPIRLHQGGPLARGLEMVRGALQSLPHGRPGLIVSPRASWTLRALSGGFCADHHRSGIPKPTPVRNGYATLVDALCTAIASSDFAIDSQTDRHYGVANDGSSYLTARR